MADKSVVFVASKGMEGEVEHRTATRVKWTAAVIEGLTASQNLGAIDFAVVQLSKSKTSLIIKHVL